ncbi:MAG: hypothetical protein V3V97_06435 [Hyphomicrobiaceae bacterium]
MLFFAFLLRHPALARLFDLFPVSVLTTSTLDQLSELQTDSTFDERRFRMNGNLEQWRFGIVAAGGAA